MKWAVGLLAGSILGFALARTGWAANESKQVREIDKRQMIIEKKIDMLLRKVPPPKKPIKPAGKPAPGKER